ncbi:ly6/PLAUR domain-containing protein 5 [Suncus etruscus]|uniref:ly6/PLAUR domain-containing protein 5 n=1 Tax=Suncus etruscus TaxID=109475 RepID=UPI00210FA783|nr:ly6/PLAUR domain-containing protein 5 [Suncus etruscus]XP_049643282.1 ly6/PLAUR domain-containing protein 5 [Suncus etruscus]
MKMNHVSCPQGCSEAVLSLNTGYRDAVTLVQKGCWTGPRSGQMQTHDEALPPDYSEVLGCEGNLCNNRLLSHDSIPNLSPASTPQRLSGTVCYACAGTHPEDCTLGKSRKVQCHQDQSVCFQGNGRMNIGNFSVPVFMRTCHRPSCTIKGTSSPWSNIDLQGDCCEGSLCNRQPIDQTEHEHSADSAAPRGSPAPTTLGLLLAALLAWALGGPRALCS